MDKEKTAIIGAGEIGKSLANVLSPVYEVYLRDREEPAEMKGKFFRVINICYPDFDGFVEATQSYIEKYKPQLVIIHSTVRPGTTKKIGKCAVHSPVNGRHPNLEEGIETFAKFVGGDEMSVKCAIEYLSKAGIKTRIMSSSIATELAKIMCTTRLGWEVVFMKEMMRICESFDVPFSEVYTDWHQAYNDGYTSLGERRFRRSILTPMEGPVGGHCIINNCNLFKNKLSEFILKENESY